MAAIAHLPTQCHCSGCQGLSIEQAITRIGVLAFVTYQCLKGGGVDCDSQHCYLGKMTYHMRGCGHHGRDAWQVYWVKMGYGLLDRLGSSDHAVEPEWMLKAVERLDELADSAHYDRERVASLKRVCWEFLPLNQLSSREWPGMTPVHQHFLNCVQEVLADARQVPESFEAPAQPRPTEEESKAALALWNEATTWEDLIRLNRDFLNGAIKETPYHCAPIDPETNDLVPQLLRLHDHHLLTTNSQPSDYMGPGTVDATHTGIQGPFAEVQCRACLEFVMPLRHPAWPNARRARFLRDLWEHPMLTVILDDKHIDPGLLINHPGDDLVWSRYREAETLTELETVEWRVDGGHPKEVMDYEDVVGTFDSYTIFEHYKALIVCVAATRSARSADIFQIIEQAALASAASAPGED